MVKHSPGPWTWRDVSGAGLQISATLPAGFELGAGRVIGKPMEIMTWTLRSSLNVEISDERWVQFSSGPWEEMQKANAQMIASAPDMLDFIQWIDTWVSNPAGCYSTDALNGLFGMARDRIANLTNVLPTEANK